MHTTNTNETHRMPLGCHTPFRSFLPFPPHSNSYSLASFIPSPVLAPSPSSCTFCCALDGFLSTPRCSRRVASVAQRCREYRPTELLILAAKIDDRAGVDGRRKAQPCNLSQQPFRTNCVLPACSAGGSVFMPRGGPPGPRARSPPQDGRWWTPVAFSAHSMA